MNAPLRFIAERVSLGTMRGCTPLDDIQLQRVLECISTPGLERQRALILLGIRTGLKLKVLLSLRWQDIAIEGRIRERIRISKIRNNRTISSFEIRVHPQASKALQQYLDICKGRVGYVFCGRSARRPMGLLNGYLLIKDVFKKAGLSGSHGELAAHTLRKTFARLVDRAFDHDLVRVNFALRNSSIESTINYLSFKEEEVDAAILGI